MLGYGFPTVSSPRRLRRFRDRIPWLGVVTAPLLIGVLGYRPSLMVDGLPQNDSLQGQIFILIGTSPDQLFDSFSRQTAEKRLSILVDSFRVNHSKVRIQVQTLPASDLSNVLLRRNRAGLSPDLVIVHSETAQALQQQKLIQPQAYPPGQLAHLNHFALRSLRLADGRFLALPISLYPQVACYNRKRLPTPPTTIKELLPPASQIRIGLAMQFTEMAWTLGSLGALDSVIAIASGQPPTPTQKQPIAAWLSWLRGPELQQRTVFQASPDGLLDEMGAGRLDWMPCRGYDLYRLRSQLGKALALAPLPSGPGGSASPLTVAQVIAFGVNSNPNQRRIAKTFVAASIDPVNQRAISMHSEGALSAWNILNLQKPSSPDMGVMMASATHPGVSGLFGKLVNANRRSDGSMQNVFNRFIYGEIEISKTVDALIQMLRPVSPQLP